MTNWLTFFGWYISEGSLGSRNKYEIHISQTKDKSKIIECVKKLGYKYYVSKDGVRIYGKSLFEYLKQFGKADKKFIPREIIELSPRLLRYLFDSLMLGDGHKYSDTNYRYISVSRQLIDDVSEISLKLGYIPTIINTDYKTNRFPNAKKC
jgi:UDP-glucuronate decarboxylase